MENSKILENSKNLRKWQIGATAFSLILGIILHFVFDWTSGNKIIGAIVPVNESTWEHLKLAFFPMLTFGIFEYFFVNKISNNYIEAKTIGIVTAIISIITLFYTYSGVIGNNYGIINILIFIIGIIAGEYASYKIMIKEDESDNVSRILSIVILVVLTIYFVLFTYVTPRINIFADPINGEYGIEAYNKDK